MPLVTIDEAERMAASLGLTVRAQPLGSQQDCNFLLTSGDGAPAGAMEHERRLLARAVSIPAEVMTGLILDDRYRGAGAGRYAADADGW